jgi:putative flippase GtrA
MRTLLPQFSRYAQVSVVSAIIQYSTLAIGVSLGIGAVSASCAGYVLGAFTGYVLNRGYTYASQAAHVSAVPRFVAVILVGLVLNALFMHLLHGYLGWHYLLAQVLTTGITMIWNFTAHRHWTFSARRVQSGGED